MRERELPLGPASSLRYIGQSRLTTGTLFRPVAMALERAEARPEPVRLLGWL
jgi:hypothetical protein